MLEFDAYRVYTGQWRAGYEGQLPVFTWGNGTSISPTRFPLGLRLPEVGHDACIGARTPDCDSLTTPFLTTRVVRSNALSSRAILDFFIIADVPDAPHHVATSMVCIEAPDHVIDATPGCADGALCQNSLTHTRFGHVQGSCEQIQ